MTELVIAQETALSKAAIEFVRSRRVAAVDRTQENAHRHARADEHLCWLVDAISQGWHPDEFVSEWDEVTPAPEERLGEDVIRGGSE